MDAGSLRVTARHSADALKEYLASPGGRRARAVLAGALIVAGPKVFRLPVIRRLPGIRIVEIVGGVALVVAVAERIRDWEPPSTVQVTRPTRSRLPRWGHAPADEPVRR